MDLQKVGESNIGFGLAISVETLEQALHTVAHAHGHCVRFRVTVGVGRFCRMIHFE